jgi:phosphotransferase system  glucose/maltose/N-acetylglucosamine-specific IIC component
MTATPATSAYEIVLAVHVMAVVVAFGVTFAYPIMFAVTARSDPRGLPLMHRVEYTIERTLINPVLGLVLIAGIFLASDGHHWGQFFVAWGVAAVVVIGAVVGSVLIPTAKRAERTAERDIAASTGDPVEMSEEYRMLTRRLQVVGTLLSLLVLVTILFMVIKP